jgi:hypothetical protein
MNRLLPILFILSIAAGHALADDDDFKLEPGFVRLDNGTDLEGWYGSRWTAEPVGDAKGWSVVDGAIRLDCDKASSHLFSKTRFSRNCVIRLEFNAAHAADSGICLHGKQFQVRDYINSLPDTQRFAGHCKPPGQWNKLELDFTDGIGKIRLNGREIVARFQLGNDSKRGLGLQREKGDFAFRRIRIREK